MKILFLPFNIASMQPITAVALNNIDGVEAKCIIDQNTKNAHINQFCFQINRASKKQPIVSIWYAFIYFYKVKKFIEWADIVHYVYAPGDKFNRDIAYAKKLNKKIFVEFVGSEIRIPELLDKINPHYKKNSAIKSEYTDIEKHNGKFKLQKLFAKFGAIPIVNPEMKVFISPILFPKVHIVYARINVESFTPISRINDHEIIKIIHNPSAMVGKGTHYIIPIINKLKEKYPIDFILNHNKKRTEVLKSLQTADIFIDQIICGSYGMASIESMAYGKPTLCYIMPEVYKNGLPEDCPIVNVNPDTLEAKLIELIENPQLRKDIGMRSRAFVEKYHDVDKIAHQLLDIYKSS